jgi:hypothetical protein
MPVGRDVSSAFRWSSSARTTLLSSSEAQTQPYDVPRADLICAPGGCLRLWLFSCSKQSGSTGLEMAFVDLGASTRSAAFPPN